MDRSEQFCLKWNQFKSHFSDELKSLTDDEDLVDVSLVSEDGEKMQAHKVILSLCSPFFKTVLKNNKHPHPLLYMRGVKMSALHLLISFIYHGEVNVPQEGLEDFLAIAQELKIKGLTNSVETNYRSLQTTDDETFLTEDPKNTCDISDTKISDTFDNDLFPVYAKQEIEEVQEEPVLDNSISQEENMIERQNGVWVCKKCGKTAKHKHHIKSHIETHVEGVSYPCNRCGKSFRSRHSLQTHTSVNHRQMVTI